MRVFETAHDYCVLPEMYIVARIDGRNFTRLTKEKHDFEVPFDIKFRDYMVETVKHLMNCGFRVIYGYTESDEISLLFHKDDGLFGRKVRKLTSILAGEASAKFSLLIGDVASFDARISELPTKDLVVDYFRWRNEDAHKNALNAHCYWTLRHNGETAEYATEFLTGMTVSGKNELLFKNGVNFNEVPNWQKRGIGFYWGEYEKTGVNAKTQEKTTTLRKQIIVDYELPMKEDYSVFIEKLLND
jgi:tRNA(His) 5'-end guanylyltransferase